MTDCHLVSTPNRRPVTAKRYDQLLPRVHPNCRPVTAKINAGLSLPKFHDRLLPRVHPNCRPVTAKNAGLLLPNASHL